MNGFVYKDKTHEYLLDTVKMTGVTTVLKSGGDQSNLITWAATQGAAGAFKEATLLDPSRLTILSLLINSFKRIDYKATAIIDKEFPEFKKARLAHATIRDTAGDTGGDAHQIIEDYEINGNIPELDKYSPESTKRALGYIQWHKDNIEKTYFVERPLFSRSLFLGGTPDGGFQMKDGKNFINDKKFKTGIHSPHPVWQMAAYRLMLEEMWQDETTPVRIEWGDGTVEEYKSPKEYLQSFGAVNWDGCVILQVNEEGKVEPIFRYAHDVDVESFKACVHIYRQVQAWPKVNLFKKNLT